MITMPVIRNPVEQFWAKVDKRNHNECWIMKPNRVRLPYGKSHLAGHKFSFLLHYGPYYRKLAVWQNCGVRNCVNPNHLCLKTRSEITGDSFDDLWVKFHASYVINDKTGCWEWVAALNVNGYGTVGSAARRLYGERLAHRVSLIIHGTEIPEQMIVCHKCDNRRCVNPEHLYAGTYVDNARDMHNRNRAKPPFRGVTECIRGHVFDEENTVWRADGSGRRCKKCTKEASSRNYMKRKAQYGEFTVVSVD